MTPIQTLIELIGRLAPGGGTLTVRDDELSQWPDEAVVALKCQGLLVKFRAAPNATCPGCEQQCFMPVHVFPDVKDAAFVICDKRDDIHRVMLPSAALAQWAFSVKAVCGFLASALEVRAAVHTKADATLWTIGMVSGNKRSLILCLRLERELALVAGNSTLPLMPFLQYGEGRYTIDAKRVRQLIDSSNTGDSRYIPNVAKRESGKEKTAARHERWRKAYEKLRAERPGKPDTWYAQQIARQTGWQGSPETIRKNMK